MINNWKNHRPLPAPSGFLLLMLLMLVMAGNALAQNLVKVEYFYDTDPGFGAGTQVAVTPPAPDLSNFSFSTSISGLNDGFHRLFVRAKDENGVWSFTHNRAFYKNTVTTPLYDLTKVEYFFNTDPGPGNGTNVPITAGPELSNLNFSIDISGLPDGFHHLYVRTKNQQGQWSITNRRPFLKQVITVSNPLLTEAEYFFNTDPGFGQGTSVPITPNGSSAILDFSIDLSSLPDGFHHLYVRVKDTEGNWSLTSRRPFLKQNVTVPNPLLTKAEYFFDTDPGFGQGTSVPITPNGSNVILDFSIDLSSLPDGFHHLYVRVKDTEGKWSLTSRRPFLKQIVTVPNPLLTKAEYFFDTDPGFGQGTSVPITPNGSNAVLDFSIDLSSLPDGFHNLYVRVKDTEGKWSLTSRRPFLKQVVNVLNPLLTKAEYFIDTDPGIGSGIQIPIPNPSSNVTDLNFEVDLSQLIMGNHMLFLRIRDENGKWSLTLLDQFCHTPQADFSANNVWLGNSTTFTDLSTSTNGNTQYRWDVNGDNVTDYTYNHGFTHTYPAAGTYNARLILISAEGCPDTTIKQVSVYTCTQPTALSVSDTTENSAILHWTQANMETAWNIEYGPTGFTQGTGTLISNVYSNNFGLFGLGSNTTYDFYVRSACYENTVSSWAGPVTFTTLEGAPCSNPTDGGTIASSQTICFGTVPASFTSVDPATGHIGILEYKWQSSSDNMVFNDIPGSNSEGLSYGSVLTATTWFRRLARVTCMPDWSGAASSDTIQISIEGRDRYRTKNSGDWDNIATWEYFNGTTWVDAVDYPSSAGIVCPNPLAVVRDGHTISVDAAVDFGNVTVDAGGILEVQNDVAFGNHFR